MEAREFGVSHRGYRSVGVLQTLHQGVMVGCLEVRVGGVVTISFSSPATNLIQLGLS